MNGGPGTLRASLLGLCPRCGKGRLYDGFLHLAKGCPACGLDYAMFDAGDGPAIFVILIGGAIAAGSALIIDSLYRPPFWIYVVIWLPLIVGVMLGLLRFVKSILLVLQFKHRAGEGRLER